MQITNQLITPTIATEMLKQNQNNRRLSEAKVFDYSSEMKAGKWLTNTGESIKFSKSGLLIDGQTRLTALVKAGVNLPFLVITDLEESVFKVIDTGKKRNATDCFKIEGIKNDKQVPSIISYYNNLKNGTLYHGSNANKLSNAALLDIYYENKVLWDDIVTHTMSWYASFSRMVKPSYIGGFYAAFLFKHPEQAKEFMQQLCSEVSVREKSILLLRKKLIDNTMSVKKYKPQHLNVLTIKAWNFFINKQDVKALAFDPQKEEEPTIQ